MNLFYEFSPTFFFTYTNEIREFYLVVAYVVTPYIEVEISFKLIKEVFYSLIDEPFSTQDHSKHSFQSSFGTLTTFTFEPGMAFIMTNKVTTFTDISSGSIMTFLNKYLTNSLHSNYIDITVKFFQKFLI